MMKSKILALLFTAFVIGLLVISGPVQSFSLGLNVNKLRPEKGETITFTAEVTIESGENLPVKELTLKIDGPEAVTCKFDADGTPISGCKDLTITKILDSTYGYGYDNNYGYGYSFTTGKLAYLIKFDTSDYKTGAYTTELKVKIGSETFSQTGRTITIKTASSDGSSSFCAPEWTCDAWSPCVNGEQFRTCYRNINYCDAEDKPAETRMCIAETYDADGNAKITLNPAGTIAPESEASISLTNFEFNEAGQFIIILLLINCIMTLLNIIIRVREMQKRQRKRLPSLKKISRK